jgi:hypothetical protein
MNPTGKTGYGLRAGRLIRSAKTVAMKGTNMRILLLSACFAVGMGIIGMSAASALPANGSVISSAQAGEQAGSLLQVGWRCGPHRHWSYRWRRCVWN